MIPFVAMVIALACAAASARRVWFAANATALHPEDVLAALDRAKDRGALERLVANEPSADWERELLAAFAAPAGHRAALVNEQLTELDLRIQRWARVPRVCARLATSAGFMLGTLALRNGLAGDGSELSSDIGELVIRGPIAEALLAVAMGILGMAFCVGAQSEAARIAKARMKSADRLVERLEALSPL